MGKQKKQNREERLRKKRLAEKKRYERIKNDEKLWKEKQEKDKIRYLKRKEEKKQLSISEMTPRQQRKQRKTWRKNFNAYYLRKKQAKITAELLVNNTPPESPQVPDNIVQANILPSPSISQSANNQISQNVGSLRSTPVCFSSSPIAASSPKYRRYRYQKEKEIRVLKLFSSYFQFLENMKKKVENYRKKLERSKLTNKQTLPTTQNKIVIRRRKKEFEHKTRRGILKNIKNDIEMFLEEDRHSRLCAGKKECIVKNKIKKQKRYLTDSLRILHQKFMKEKNIIISYASFCKLRPFWILFPDIKSRETCLCKLHTNVDLIIQAMKHKKVTSLNNSQELLRHMCCDPYNVKCLQRKCEICKNKVVPYLEFDDSITMQYWQWVTKVNLEINKKSRVTEKVKVSNRPREVIKVLNILMIDFLNHCANITGQFQAIKHLKSNLLNGQFIIHMDFSENYSVKCGEEIQSYHFGSSRRQITLHTCVIYYRADSDSELKHTCLCTVSDCLRHDISAVWAHIIPIITYISENINPFIECIHFVTDSPSSQYRNKKIFHLISSLQQYQNTLRTITWNYSETGHGKGAPDGVGAAVKQAADKAVSCGKDINNLEDFLSVTKTLNNVVIKTVSEYDVYEKDLLFPQKVSNFPGCMKMHQIVWTFDSNQLAARTLSCIEKPCIEEPILCQHGKHLGFYIIINNNPNIPVRSLANSTKDISMLRNISWLNSLDQNRKIAITQDPEPSTSKGDKIKIISNVVIKPPKNKNVNAMKNCEENNKNKESKYLKVPVSSSSNREKLKIISNIEVKPHADKLVTSLNHCEENNKETKFKENINEIYNSSFDGLMNISSFWDPSPEDIDFI